MKQKRDEKGRFEKKETGERNRKRNAAFAFGFIVGVESMLLLFIIAVLCCGFGSTNDVKTITISDKLLKTNDDYSTVITCTNDAFWVKDDVIYSTLKVGNTYTVKTYGAIGYYRLQITEIITNNDPPAAECSG